MIFHPLTIPPHRTIVKPESPWMRKVLLCAALYNLAWGAWVVARPFDLFQWAGIAPPNYPAVWQSVGMIVGVYGIAYALAAIDPVLFWPITLTGLIGKILGPIGFLGAALSGQLPWQFGVTILTNDLIWWAPFALILRGAWRQFREEPDAYGPVWQRARTEEGEQLGEMSFRWPILLVALRHAGCPFCREALAELARERRRIEFTGTRIVLAHLGTPREGERLTSQFGLDDLPRVADPNRLLYHAVGLKRGSFMELFGPRVWWRGFDQVILKRRGIWATKSDMFQMGGVFLIHRGRIEREFHYKDASDQPDFVQITRLETSVAGN